MGKNKSVLLKRRLSISKSRAREQEHKAIRLLQLPANCGHNHIYDESILQEKLCVIFLLSTF